MILDRDFRDDGGSDARSGIQRPDHPLLTCDASRFQRPTTSDRALRLSPDLIPSGPGLAGRLLSLGNYLLLVDYTGRLFREGKAAISRELTEILDRLGSNAENWEARLTKLAGGRLLGRFFAASRERLKQVADGLGMRRLPNLAGCPVR